MRVPKRVIASSCQAVLDLEITDARVTRAASAAVHGAAD
jgi:hypothetical protein